VGNSIDELLVSQRGPNEFLGALVALDPDFIAGRWKMHVVARTQVQVRLKARLWMRYWRAGRRGTSVACSCLGGPLDFALQPAGAAVG
jgi:hypothetical protein